MNLLKQLEERSQNKCELCGSIDRLEVYQVPPNSTASRSDSILSCHTCKSQLEDPEQMDGNHWRCLNEAIWSEVSAVQIVSWRILHRLKDEGWPQDLLEMMYLSEEDLAWASATGEGQEAEEEIVHKDVNGVVLQTGDSVVLIKDLKVKGSSLVAKQGTPVRRISLDRDNEEYIEGKVDGTQIVILTKYVKKTS